MSYAAIAIAPTNWRWPPLPRGHDGSGVFAVRRQANVFWRLQDARRVVAQAPSRRWGSSPRYSTLRPTKPGTKNQDYPGPIAG
jgi:hypothetical protein